MGFTLFLSLEGLLQLISLSTTSVECAESLPDARVILDLETLQSGKENKQVVGNYYMVIEHRKLL